MAARPERGALRPERLEPVVFRRALRKEATPAEQRLWTILRAERLDGLKFRRQHDLGPFVIDFYCAEARLAIELDGSIHDDPARAATDTRRQRALEARGVCVLRFSNDDVGSQIEAVVAGIHAAAGRPPHPSPLPPRGEGT